jgi:Ni/Fe-hydrogenase 1 B-type cytochrome subunit
LRFARSERPLSAFDAQRRTPERRQLPLRWAFAQISLASIASLRDGRSVKELADTKPETLIAHPVWDAPTRWFHWVNALLFGVLVLSGLLIQFMRDLHIEGGPAKIALKICHVVPGYLACINLFARWTWGFFGNHFVRWAQVLPNKASFADAWAEAKGLVGRRPTRAELGHGALGRLSSTWLFGLLLVMVVTGLVRAGTDLFYPPFGAAFADYIALPGTDPAAMDPVTVKQWSDPARFDQLTQLKLLAGRPHIIGAYALMISVTLHVAGVVLKEVRQGGGVFSSMITGRKVFPTAEPPDDARRR